MIPKPREYMSEMFREAEAKGMALALLRVIQARGLEVTDAQRDLIQACTDRARLNRWLDAAVGANTVDEILLLV